MDISRLYAASTGTVRAYPTIPYSDPAISSCLPLCSHKFGSVVQRYTQIPCCGAGQITSGTPDFLSIIPLPRPVFPFQDTVSPTGTAIFFAKIAHHKSKTAWHALPRCFYFLSRRVIAVREPVFQIQTRIFKGNPLIYRPDRTRIKQIDVSSSPKNAFDPPYETNVRLVP